SSGGRTARSGLRVRSPRGSRAFRSRAPRTAACPFTGRGVERFSRLRRTPAPRHCLAPGRAPHGSAPVPDPVPPSPPSRPGGVHGGGTDGTAAGQAGPAAGRVADGRPEGSRAGARGSLRRGEFRPAEEEGVAGGQLVQDAGDQVLSGQ